VYVYDTYDLLGQAFGAASLEDDGKPILHLASRGTETSRMGELSRATATAIHELCHAFTMRWWSPGRVDSQGCDPWEWWSEGTSVFMETHVSPENQDSLRYVGRWADHPEVPIDDPYHLYQAGMFVRYLYHHPRLGAKFITAVWEEPELESESEQTESVSDPCSAIEKVLARDVPNLAFASPEEDDIFAAGYCVDSYFCFDTRSACFNPFVFVRFGERQATESYEPPICDAATQDSLDHLACRYYRFMPPSNSAGTTLNVRLTANPQGKESDIEQLKGILAVVTTNWSKGETVVLEPASEERTLESSMQNFTSGDVDHIVLIVANCSYGENARDGLRYAISAEVV